MLQESQFGVEGLLVGPLESCWFSVHTGVLRSAKDGHSINNEADILPRKKESGMNEYTPPSPPPLPQFFLYLGSHRKVLPTLGQGMTPQTLPGACFLVDLRSNQFDNRN